MQLTIEVQTPNEMQLLLQYVRLLPTAKVVGEQPSKPLAVGHAIEKPFRQFGFAKGFIARIAPDFDETPPGFEEYMPPTAP